VTWRPEMTTVASEGEEGEAKQVLVSRVTFLDSATLSDDAAAAVAEVPKSPTGRSASSCTTSPPRSRSSAARSACSRTGSSISGRTASQERAVVGTPLPAAASLMSLLVHVFCLLYLLSEK